MTNLNKGLFITFEGPDHSGKTTQILLLKETLEKMGFDVVMTREPGGTRISEKIREIIIDPNFSEMTARTETLLYEAARSQVINDVIKPALNLGKVVLCDRFSDSTVAYQGYGRELGGDEIDIVNNWATEGLEPNFTFYFALPREEAKNRGELRNNQTGEDMDRLEQEGDDFYNKVNKGYQDLLEAHPARIVRVNASKTRDEIQAFILRALEAKFTITEKREQDDSALDFINNILEGDN